MSEPATDQQLDVLTAAYTVPAGHFDELLSADGTPRAWWRALAAHADLSPAHLRSAQTRIARQIHDNGVTYNVYAAEDGPTHPWALDVVPFLMPGAEWTALAPGLRQRARLLNAIAADLYGSQQLLREGVMPPGLAFRHSGYLRPCCGVQPPGGMFLHLVAFDLARDASGCWRVVNTRVQSPSGAGYALENRTAIPRMFPGAFRDLHVQPLAPFFETLKDSILTAAPCDEPSPYVVLLTPGPYNETYFEHTYLARHLGFPLVEGADLTVRHDRVFLKTISGLRQVHAILRRLDDDYCDPLELRSDSTLGVPGLVQAWRSGRVLVANAFGTSVLESPALSGVLPGACERLLSEPFESASVSTRWPCDPSLLDAATGQGGVVKSAFPNLSMEPVFLDDLDAAGRDAWARRFNAAPDAHVLEERLPLSHAPTWNDGRLEGRALMLRVFLAADGRGDYVLMPGGLSRIAADARPIVSSQHGGSSKDTWVLADPDVPGTGDVRRAHREQAVQADSGVSSRAAEHLFWLGRYAERAESTARLLRSVLSRLTDPAAPEMFQPLFLRACLSQGLLEPGEIEAGADLTSLASTHALSLRLVENLFDRRSHRSLGYNVDQTVRAAGAVRERLSPDNWRLLVQLLELVLPASRAMDFDDTLALIDQIIVSLVAVGGLEMAHMTRDDGWRFLSVGRHLERLTFVASTIDLLEPHECASPALLTWLLELSDSLLTFRARYARQPEWPAVVELLVFDARNPRSVLFQLAKVAKHVPALPGATALDAMADFDALERMCRSDDRRQGELFGHVSVDEVLARSRRASLRLSDALTLRYFSHAYELSHATAGR